MPDIFVGGLDSTELELGPANVYLSDELSDALVPPGVGPATMRHLGFLGENMQIATSIEAIPLTGAQTGTTALSKVISGGQFRMTIPLKEFSFEKIAAAFPNSVHVNPGGEGGFERIDFIPRVGLNMRTLARKLVIIKVFGEVESADPIDKITVPFAAPVDAEVTIPFSPTEQRVIEAVFEAWPDPNHSNRWAFIGHGGIEEGTE